MSSICIPKVCAFIICQLYTLHIATTDDMKWVPIGNQAKMVQQMFYSVHLSLHLNIYSPVLSSRYTSSS